MTVQMDYKCNNKNITKNSIKIVSLIIIITFEEYRRNKNRNFIKKLYFLVVIQIYCSRESPLKSSLTQM